MVWMISTSRKQRGWKLIRIFIGRIGKYQVPKGAKVEVIKFYPRRRALILYEGQKILTFSTLLRKLADLETCHKLDNWRKVKE